MLDVDRCEGYIFNMEPKQNIPIHQDNGVYVMIVDFMVEDESSVEATFRRQE